MTTEIEQGTARLKKHLPWESWGVKIASLLTVLTGIINLTSAVQPALNSRLLIIETFIPLEVRHGSRMTSALAGFALLLLAGGLWRRKGVAWALSVLLLVVSIITHLVKGLDFEEASLSLGLLGLLVLLRRSFHAASDRPSVRQGLIVLATALGFTLIYGAAGFYLLDKHFAVHYGLVDALRQTLVMFTSFYNPGLESITGFGRYFAGSIYVVGFATMSFALLMLIRPVLVRQPARKEERLHATEIVKAHGRTALARATLFDDKSYYFSPGGSVIAYGVRGRGAMALGDPIGPAEDAPDAIQGFKELCRRNDWAPSFISTLPDHLDAYRAAGFDIVCIGYEAIVPLRDFSLEGSANKDLRYAVNRMERTGFHAEIHLPPLDDKLMHSLHEISNAWLTLRHGGEMHFSDGWFDAVYIRNSPVVVIHAPDGSPTAFANLVPEYQKNEMSLDLMRHYAHVEYGTMESLFVRMLQGAREHGCDTFSLGLSAIIGVGEKPDDPRVEQALNTIARYLSRFYNFRGLHDFKEKFHPRWEPRYLAYPGVANLPLVLSTLLRVHAGDDYLARFMKN